MKIALLHYTSPPIVGGVESVLAHHAHLMSEAGHEVAIFAGRGKPLDENLPLHLLPLLDSRNTRVMAVKHELDDGRCTENFAGLRDQIEAELSAELIGFDVLIAHNVVSLHKNLALTAALYALHTKHSSPRLILWHHDLAWATRRYRHEMHPGYPWDLLQKPWEDVTQVVISKIRQKELAQLLGIAVNMIHVIPNGVDPRTFFKLEMQTIQLVNQLHLFEADPLFLLPVRLTPRKNIELALRILAEVRQEYPGAMLLVTGPEGAHNPANAAYRKKLLDLREAMGLHGAVHFLADVSAEFIPDKVIADLYRLADALLFTSREEGFGIPLIEAAVSRMPVFCTDIPVLRELGNADVSYFDPDASPGSVAAQIIRRLEGDASSRWARRARHHFTWDSIFKQQIAPLLQEVGK
jgi:glycosyltransferase involved in cell wall biosynthesis